MAGDWMKVELDTPDKPEVVGIAARLRIDQDAVTGKLFRIWAWADRNSVDGERMSITPAFIDRLTNRKGFADAMVAVGWLLTDGDFLTFPGFTRHNGKSAKARGETNRRVAKHRKGNASGVTSALQKQLPEKRREDITPIAPEGGESGGDDFLIGKIKSLRKRWGNGAALDARDARVYGKNRDAWQLYQAEDWEVVAEFMRASLPEGTAYTQPLNLNLALGMPTNLLADARDWKSKQRPRLSVVPSPVATAEPPATAEEVAATFAKFKP